MENSTKKIKIYLADTEMDNLQKIEEFFAEKEGYLVIGKSSSGEEVVSDVTKLQPDFLISEVLLPEKDGFKVIPGTNSPSTISPTIPIFKYSISTFKISPTNFFFPSSKIVCIFIKLPKFKTLRSILTVTMFPSIFVIFPKLLFI